LTEWAFWSVGKYTHSGGMLEFRWFMTRDCCDA
jgi:hypothetical protein